MSERINEKLEILQREQAAELGERQPKIEIYTDKYNEGVVKLIFDVYENELGHYSKTGRPDLYKIPEIYLKDKCNFWVALYGGKVIGTVALLDEGEQRGSMHRFCVDKKFREKGLGARLFSTFLEFAGENGYKKIFLSTDEDWKKANKFYIKNRFKRIKSLPEDISSRSYFIHDNVFYELDLKEASEEK